MSWDGKIPFSEGCPLVYPQGQVVWRDNEPFEDELFFEGFTRGRSAARAVFGSTLFASASAAPKGRRVPVQMFLTDLADAMPHIEEGVLRGTFRFCKRGENFGITLVAPRPKP